jgi:hypothetical protein
MNVRPMAGEHAGPPGRLREEGLELREAHAADGALDREEQVGEEHELQPEEAEEADDPELRHGDDVAGQAGLAGAPVVDVKESTSAGPEIPAASPVRTKIPTPIMAPTPTIVMVKRPRSRESSTRCTAIPARRCRSRASQDAGTRV